jgi:hypothetical protein
VVTADWDMSWVERIRGTYRGVFDTSEVSEGLGFFRAARWPKQVIEVYGVARSDITSVLVLRHNAIPFIMNDAYWTEYGVGKAIKLRGDGKKWATANPIASVPEGTPPQFADMTVPGFLAAGGIILACHLAFQDVIGQVARKHALAGAAAEARARTMLLPGVILQPSGFFAVLRAQQAGCGYMLAG